MSCKIKYQNLRQGYVVYPAECHETDALQVSVVQLPVTIAILLSRVILRTHGYSALLILQACVILRTHSYSSLLILQSRIILHTYGYSLLLYTIR